MKNKILYLVILALTLNFWVSCKEGVAQEEDAIEMITPDEAEKISKMKDVKLLDVRTEEEFDEGHIANAQNLVYDENFSEKIAELDKSKPVIVYCKSGGRSEKCAQILKDSGFVKIYDLKGGITEWKFKGKTTKK